MKLFGLEIRAAPGLSPVADNRGGWWSIREPYTGAWQRNIEWTTDTVLAHHAVYACITRIAQDIGKLRPKLVERDEDGIWSELENAAFSPVLRRPNHFQNHIQFKEWWATSKLTHGNAYALIDRDNRGIPKAFYILDPSRVTVMVSPDGSVFYDLKQDNLAGQQDDNVSVPASEIIHDRINPIFHPLVGNSPIFACGTAANMGLQIEQNSSAFFGNGSNPSGILSSVVSITPEKAGALSELWNARFGKDKSGGVAVLGDGMKFEAMRMTATDSQLIEQLGWTAETVCSAFHVPPFKIGIGTQPTYQNGEILNSIYYSDCLQSHIEAFELCFDRALGLDVEKIEGRWMGVELDLDGLLRMDTASLVTSLTSGIRGGLFTPNEGRKRMDLEPLKGGDTIYLQHQDYPMEMVFEREDLDPAEPVKAIPEVPEQKQLPAGPSDEDRMAQLAALIEINAQTLRIAA